MIQQRITMLAGSAISGTSEIPDKRQLAGIYFPTGFNGTATWIIEQTFDGGLTWVETYTSANVLFNPGWTLDKVVPLPQEIGNSVQRFRVKVPTNQLADRTLIALVK